MQRVLAETALILIFSGCFEPEAADTPGEATPAAPQQTIRTYDIRDLTPSISVFPAPCSHFPRRADWPECCHSDDPELLQALKAEIAASHDKLDAASIVETISRRTDGAWGAGSSIEARNGKIVVVQTADVHETIRTILGEIRRNPAIVEDAALPQ